MSGESAVLSVADNVGMSDLIRLGALVSAEDGVTSSVFGDVLGFVGESLVRNDSVSSKSSAIADS